MPSVHSPHDALFRKLLEHPETLIAIIHDHAPAEFAAVINGPPRLVEATQIDSETLERTTSDAQVEVPVSMGPPHFSSLLLEHKSDPDPRALLTLLKRVLGIWEAYAKDSARRMNTLPVAQILLFYHGAKPWSLPDSLDLSFPKGDGWIGLRLRIIAVDLSKRDPERLSSSPFAQAGFRLMLYASRKGRARKFRDLVAALRDIPDDVYFSKPLMAYITDLEDEDLVSRAMSKANPRRGEAIMLTAREKWQAEARAEARPEHEAAMFVRVLEQKFGRLPEHSRALVASASPAQIDAWVARLFKAKSLEALLGAVPRR